jgi:hypothetical protein
VRGCGERKTGISQLWRSWPKYVLNLANEIWDDQPVSIAALSGGFERQPASSRIKKGPAKGAELAGPLGEVGIAENGSA